VRAWEKQALQPVDNRFGFTSPLSLGQALDERGPLAYDVDEPKSRAETIDAPIRAEGGPRISAERGQSCD
jgi:hypothetical protein